MRFSFPLNINLLLLIKLFVELILILTVSLIQNEIYRSNAFLISVLSVERYGNRHMKREKYLGDVGAVPVCADIIHTLLS